MTQDEKSPADQTGLRIFHQNNQRSNLILQHAVRKSKTGLKVNRHQLTSRLNHRVIQNLLASFAN
jgi:hypothetical protein